jgi:membrane protease YdiL (CAAX protease family)
MIGLILWILLITAGIFLVLYLFLFNKKYFLHDSSDIIRKKIWDVSDIEFVLILLCLAYLAVIVLRIYGKLEDDLVHVAITKPLILVYLLFILPFTQFIAVLLLLKKHRISCSDAFGIDKQKIRYHLWIAFILTISTFPFVEFSRIFYWKLIVHTKITQLTLQPVVQILANHEVNIFIRLYMILLGVIVSPIVEELIFRGIILPALLKYTGLWQAVIFLSLVFAMIHWHLPAFLPLFVMSIIFCYGYLYTGSLITPIGMHVLFNTLATLSALIK